MINEKFAVTGMTCSACSSRVEKCVSALDGINTCEVNLLTGSMQTSYDETILSTESIIAAVEKAGYGASSLSRAGLIRRQSRGSVCRKFPAGSHAESAEGNEIPADLLLPVLDSADVCVHVPYVL